MTDLIYVPDVARTENCAMAQFSRFVEARAGLEFGGYDDLHRYSVREAARFWPLLLEWLDLDVTGSTSPALTGSAVEEAVFFPGLRLNYAANLLRSHEAGDDARLALVCWDEDGRAERITRGELTRRVLWLASELQSAGVGVGTRVAAIARNTADAVVACLASTALGAIWCSAGIDLGHDALIGRLGQFEPEILFYHARQRLGGTSVSLEERLRALVAELPALRLAIGLDDERVELLDGSVQQPPFARPAPGSAPVRPYTLDALPRVPFNHPLFVLFTSGTTGVPKGLVHGTGGTLLEHNKEHTLHTGLIPGDLLYFQTTCGWMMWNWTLSALACRAAIVLYDGVVGHPSPQAQIERLEQEGVTVFGTSPSFLQALRGARHEDRLAPTALRLVLSTGSVLPAPLFTWIRDELKAVPVQSISGGTDIIGCFLLGNPMLAVHAGELQCRSLGYDVGVAPADVPMPSAEDVVEAGELVCRSPFPSRPIGMLNDPDGARFHSTYFSQHPGWWTHGDLVEFTARGGARILGRSDGVLNVGGVRIGPAEIRQALVAVTEVRESVVVEQRGEPPAKESRIVLVVVLERGRELDRSLQARIRSEIRARCSPAHVPALIVAVSALPVTHNGKQSERAVREAVNGDAVVNLEALRNPECLDEIRAQCARTGPSAAVVEPVATTGLSDNLARVIGIWESVLGTSVSADDVFFDIGGDSLRGLYLLNGVEREFGVRFAMSSLLHSASTPTGMTELLAAAASGGGRSTVVPLYRGASGCPVFWVPGGGLMSVLAYREISQRLGDRPVFGLEARLYGEPSPDLQHLAGEFVEAMLATAPQGPHILLGFSAGAFVAYEMAAQLARRGMPPALVVIFDAHLPVRRRPLEELRILVQRAAYHGRQLAARPAARWPAYLVEAFGLLKKRAFERIAPKRARGWRHEVGDTAEAQTDFDARDHHNRGLVAAYRAGALPTIDPRVAIILAERSSWSGVTAELDPRLAWRALVRDPVEVKRVSGSHLSMLDPPDVDSLGATLRELVSAAECATHRASSRNTDADAGTWADRTELDASA